jgi:hypothetical protein
MADVVKRPLLVTARTTVIAAIEITGGASVHANAYGS